MNKNRVTPTEVGVVGVCTDFSCNNCKKKGNKRLLKIFAASGLAIMMGIGTLCGVLISPMNSTHASTSGGNMPTNSADLYNNGIITKDDLNQETPSGEAVVLDPGNDKTIFKTASGFEIKSHTVAGQTLANSKVQYFTMGSYNGTPLNWIILATSPTLAENTTDAGIAINSANSKGLVSMMTDSKLSANQILVLSEKVIPIASTFNVVAKSGTIKGTLGKYSSDRDTNAKYYAGLLLDEASDYYSNYNLPDLSMPNTWSSNNTLSLSTYLGTNIIKNNNFSANYYVFVMSSVQLSTYLPTNLFAAKDISGTLSNYWCSDSFNTSITNSISSGRVSGYFSDGQYGSVVYATGTGTCTFGEGGKYVNKNGNIVSPTTIKITGTLTHSGHSDFAWVSQPVAYPKCTYSITSGSETIAYYRPAMVIDFSKF